MFGLICSRSLVAARRATQSANAAAVDVVFDGAELNGIIKTFNPGGDGKARPLVISNRNWLVLITMIMLLVVVVVVAVVASMLTISLLSCTMSPQISSALAVVFIFVSSNMCSVAMLRCLSCQVVALL